MKRTPLRRRSKAKPQRAYVDSRGVAFDEVRSLLGEDRSRWPAVRRVDNVAVCEEMHIRFSGRHCWNCRACCLSCIEAHHIFGGRYGRSDELCNLAMLGGEFGCGCHAKVNTPALPLGRILYLKWRYDAVTTDWERLTLLRGSFLPELVTKP